MIIASAHLKGRDLLASHPPVVTPLVSMTPWAFRARACALQLLLLAERDELHRKPGVA